MATVITEVKDGILYVTLNRPEARNALDDTINNELLAVWRKFEVDPECDVAILSAAGKAFCAGADLNSWIPKWENATPGDLREAAKLGIGGGITRGLKITKPVIAAIHGHCVGGGLEIALACDIRVASTDAKFGSPEVGVGLHSGDGGLVRLANIAGLGVALELSMTGRIYDAEEAYRLRIVNRVVPREELLGAAEEYARKILANSQRAVRSAKETLHGIIGRPLDDALFLETFNAYSCPGDFSDAKARIAAFTQKRSK